MSGVSLMYADSTSRAAEAAGLLHLSLKSAEKLESQSLILQNTTLLALIADMQDDPERDQLAQRWDTAKTGNIINLSHSKEQVRQIGEIVKLVGVRVAEGWR